MATCETIVFDLDGTLLDTLEDLMISTNAALAEHGMPERTLDEVRRFVGNGAALLVHRAVPAGTTPEKEASVLEGFKRHYERHCEDHTAPYDGVPELLAHLREAGRRLAVVSNKPDFAVQELVERRFPGVFECALGECEERGIRRKPAPDMVEAVLDRLGVTREGLVYVGDSEVDVATAAACGCRCLSCSWGFRDRGQLLEAGATLIVDTPGELERVLLAGVS